MVQWLSERLGHQFVMDNRPGAGGNIGTEVGVRAPADGYTLLVVSTAAAINATLYNNLRFNYLRDIEPIAALTTQPQVLLVTPSLPVQTVPELIAYAKANPGKLNMASPTPGTIPHVAGELFKMMTDIDMVHVPYRGSPPALNDLLAGRAHVMFHAPLGVLEFVKAGRLRALAISGARRSQAIPDLPVVSDFVPGYEAIAWLGLGAPRQTPRDVIDLLNREINAALADATMQKRIDELGAAPFPGTPSDFGRFIEAETEKWAKVVKFSGAKPE